MTELIELYERMAVIRRMRRIRELEGPGGCLKHDQPERERDPMHHRLCL